MDSLATVQIVESFLVTLYMATALPVNNGAGTQIIQAYICIV